MLSSLLAAILWLCVLTGSLSLTPRPFRGETGDKLKFENLEWCCTKELLFPDASSVFKGSEQPVEVPVKSSTRPFPSSFWIQRTTLCLVAFWALFSKPLKRLRYFFFFFIYGLNSLFAFFFQSGAAIRLERHIISTALLLEVD